MKMKRVWWSLFDGERYVGKQQEMVSHPGSAHIWKTLAPLNLRWQIEGAITRIQNLRKAAGQKPSGKVGTQVEDCRWYQVSSNKLSPCLPISFCSYPLAKYNQMTVKQTTLVLVMKSMEVINECRLQGRNVNQ